MSNNCVSCGEDTTFGSGRFVNRIPADDGYMCSECASYECCRCGKLIGFDEDISPDMVFGEDDDPGEFPDGSWRLHKECLTRDEQELLILNDTELRSFQKEFLMKEIAEKYKGEQTNGQNN